MLCSMCFVEAEHCTCELKKSSRCPVHTTFAGNVFRSPRMYLHNLSSINAKHVLHIMNLILPSSSNSVRKELHTIVLICIAGRVLPRSRFRNICMACTKVIKSLFQARLLARSGTSWSRNYRRDYRSRSSCRPN